MTQKHKAKRHALRRGVAHFFVLGVPWTFGRGATIKGCKDYSVKVPQKKAPRPWLWRGVMLPKVS